MRENCTHDCHQGVYECDPCLKLHDLAAYFGPWLTGYAKAAAAASAITPEMQAYDRGASTASRAILDTWHDLTRPRPGLAVLPSVEAPAEPSTCPAKRIAGPGQPNAVLYCQLGDDHAGDHRDDQTIPGETWAWSTGLPAYQLLDDEPERPIAHLSPMP